MYSQYVNILFSHPFNTASTTFIFLWQMHDKGAFGGHVFKVGVLQESVSSIFLSPFCSFILIFFSLYVEPACSFCAVLFH